MRYVILVLYFVHVYVYNQKHAHVLLLRVLPGFDCKQQRSVLKDIHKAVMEIIVNFTSA